MDSNSRDGQRRPRATPMTADASAGVLLLDHSDVLVTVKRSFYDLYFGLLVPPFVTWQASCTPDGFSSYHPYQVLHYDQTGELRCLIVVYRCEANSVEVRSEARG